MWERLAVMTYVCAANVLHKWENGVSVLLCFGSEAVLSPDKGNLICRDSELSGHAWSAAPRRSWAPASVAGGYDLAARVRNSHVLCPGAPRTAPSANSV